MTDPLDWQILDDKAPEDPEPPPVPVPDRPPSRTRWWWFGGLLAGGALAALVAPFLFPPSRETQLHTTVLSVVANEPLLSPIAYAIAVPGPIQIDAIDDDGVGRIRASLSYTATDVDGQVLRFSLERSLVTEGTLLASDPGAIDRTVVTLSGGGQAPHLELAVLAADRDFIERDVAPYLDEVARRACEIWSCPEWTTVHLALTQGEPGAGERAINPIAGSWMLASAAETIGATPIEFAAPALAGRPADPATLDVYRRRLALRLLPLLARSVVEPPGMPTPSVHNALVAEALAARTAVLLGLEPISVAAAQPASDDAGLISDSPAQRSVLVERALLRLNAFLGSPGSAIERDLWARLSVQPNDAIVAAVDLAHAAHRPPQEALDLFWGGGFTRLVVRHLTGTDWTSQLACVDSVHVTGAAGTSVVRWDTLSTGRVLELGPLSEDGAYQALVFVGHPLLLEGATGRLLWMVWPDPIPGRSPRFAWDDTQTFDGIDALGAWAAQITFDPRHASAIQTSPKDVLAATAYRWQGRTYRISLPDTSGSDSRVFRAQQVMDSNGAVIADWGQAAWSSRDPRTGEIAVLSRVEDPALSAEYRITVYADPTDPVGRVVWRSREFGWTADQPLAWAAIQWIGDAHELVGIVRSVNEDHYVPLPVVWRTNPDTAQSVELPALKLASSTIFDFSVSADGRYLALVSTAAQGPGTRTSIVSTADGQLLNVFDLQGGLLTWSPRGHAFAFQGGDRPDVYARPEDRAPIWSPGDTSCASPVWRPAQTPGSSASVTR